MKKYCTKCGKPFDAIGREVICPDCKAQAAEDAKRAAVLKAKQASWTGESVPVRISGRASTVIRHYGAANNMPFAAALDALLQASDYVVSSGKAWGDITPYKSRRRDKATSASPDVLLAACRQLLAPQEVPQDVKQEIKQEIKQDVKQAAKQASKASASKVAAKATSKASASKATSSKASDSKASKASASKEAE